MPYHKSQTAWTIVWTARLQPHDIWPLNLNFTLEPTFKNFPNKLMLSKVTLCHQITFISRCILKRNRKISQKENYSQIIKLQHTKFMAITSQDPILRSEPEKFDAFSLSVAAEVDAPLVSWLFTAVGFSGAEGAMEEALFCDSLIVIKSNKDGLFLNLRPKGLGSSSGLYSGGGTGNSSFPASHC